MADKSSLAKTLLSLPPEVLAKIPALAPPPGIKSNFVDPESRGPAIIAVCTVFMILTVLIWMSRIYTRFYILRRPYWDDLTVTLGLAFAIVKYIGTVIGCNPGPYGKHQWDVNLLTLTDPNTAISTYLQSLSWAFSQGFVKVTFFLLYFMVFGSWRWMRICVYIGVAVTSAFYLAFAIADIALATPKKGEAWFASFVGPGQAKVGEINIGMCGAGLAFDVLILALPIRAVSKLQTQTKRKVGIALIFSTGVFACICSAASLGLRLRAEGDPDQFWSQSLVQLFALLELLLGIIAACMPTATPFFNHERSIIKKTRDIVSSQISLLRTSRGSSNKSNNLPSTTGRSQYFKSHDATRMTTARSRMKDQSNSSRETIELVPASA